MSCEINTVVLNGMISLRLTGGNKNVDNSRKFQWPVFHGSSYEYL